MKMSHFLLVRFLNTTSLSACKHLPFFMPIYTKKGDKGTTKLPFDKRKRSKASCRVQALGEVDELNSLVGVIVSFLKDDTPLRKWLVKIQSELFLAQMDIASKGKTFEDRKIKPLTEKHVKQLEKEIDEMTSKLPPLSKFILPGGSHAGAFCQLARAVCRRTERELAQLKRKEKVNPAVVQYLNRLSDYLFTSARFINFNAGAPESNPNYYNEDRPSED